MGVIIENQVPDYLLRPTHSSPKIFHKIEKNLVLKSYIESLFVYFESPNLFTSDTIQLKLKELISLLYNMNNNSIKELLLNLFNPSQLEFKEVIARHLFNDLSLEDYATLLNMSLSTFKRKFKALYDTSPGKYIFKKRLEKAAQLLASSNQRIGDICYDCGFTDLSNFSKAFSKKYGVPPTAYQKRALS